MSVLENFANLLHAASAEREAVEKRLSVHLLDSLGALIAAVGTTEGQALVPAGPLSPLRDDALDRIARAAALIRLTEVDDIHIRSCTTPGSVVFPVAFILARLAGAKPAQAAAAIAAGYEAIVRFAEAARGPTILYDGLWPTYLAAPIGAAAAASLLFGLNRSATAHALSIALAQASGAPGRPEGKSPRWLLIGLAARAGCVAALAARQGFEGDLGLLDGDWLAKTHGLAFDNQAMAGARVGAAVLETSQKPYCGAKQTMAASEAFRQILQEGVSAPDVERARIFVPTAYFGMVSRAPDSRSGRIVSAAYQLALAAHRPSDLLDLERGPLNDPRLASFLDKVQVLADPELDAFYPREWPARVEVETKGGARRQCAVRVAKGDPGRRLDMQECERKFGALVEPTEGRERCDRLRRAALSAFSADAAFETVCGEFFARSGGAS